MTREELKNKISMALKDPILQQGFEIICKNLAGLEKENAELKGIKDVATLIRANNDTVVTLMQLNNKLVSKSQQLTKATEIIKRLKSLIEDVCDINYLSKNNTKLLEKVEQFLEKVK